MEVYFTNPELGLYMDDDLFGGAVPGFTPLRIQRNSLQAFDFGNTHDGLYPIRAINGGAGTALDTNLFGNYLLRAGQPRSVDILPIFHTGVPNLAPYQLATGKNGNPLAPGKPFINNFLPTFGDMLRLNMAVPVTPRNSAGFSPLGIVQAAVLGLTDPAYNANANLQFIPNMDGFPNGRRLEDDVTRIELQAVAGVALAAVGLWYDDYTAGGPNPVTTDLISVLGYTTGVEANDTSFRSSFPYVQTPWSGTGKCSGRELNYTQPTLLGPSTGFLGVQAPQAFATAFPSVFNEDVSVRYRINTSAKVEISIFDLRGNLVKTLVDKAHTPGEYTLGWNASGVAIGTYLVKVRLEDGSKSNTVQTLRIVKAR
jgi:hypothetical protein